MRQISLSTVFVSKRIRNKCLTNDTDHFAGINSGLTSADIDGQFAHITQSNDQG